MIDTMRFKIPLNQELREQLSIKSIQHTKKNNESNIVFYNSEHIPVSLPSWNYEINLFFSDTRPDVLYLELSLPKFLYGHNLWLIYGSEVVQCVQELYVYLSRHLGVSLPPIIRWEVVRADLCYSWRFRTQDQARAIMGILQNYNFPRKKTFRAATSVMCVGSDYSVKFYLKNEEFFAHDFKRIQKQDINDAYRLLSVSDGILRYEVTLRRDSVRRWFNTSKATILDFQDDDITGGIMTAIMSKMLGKVKMEAMSNAEALDILCTRFNPTRACNLWKYYLLTRGTDFFVREKIKAMYSRSQNWRLQRDLVQAGIGMSLSDSVEQYDLNIPSKFVVNPQPIPR